MHSVNPLCQQHELIVAFLPCKTWTVKLILFNLFMVEQKFSDAKEGSWILGGGWNNDLWGGELPLASWIDDITPYNPVSGDFINFGF